MPFVLFFFVDANLTPGSFVGAHFYGSDLIFRFCASRECDRADLSNNDILRWPSGCYGTVSVRAAYYPTLDRCGGLGHALRRTVSEPLIAAPNQYLVL